MTKDQHIGQLLQQYIRENSISKAALARALEIDPSNLEIRLNRSFMRTDFLIRVCVILEHNFFADIGATLPEGFTVSAEPDNTLLARIAELERENSTLERERNMLSGIMSRKISGTD